MKERLKSTLIHLLAYGFSHFNQCHLCNIKSTTLICNNCRNGLDENLTFCRHCKLPTEIPLVFCGNCQKKAFGHHLLIAPYLYKGILKTLISQLKFNQATHHSQLLCLLLAEKLKQEYVTTTENQKATFNSTWPSTLIYVPSHTERIRERGFCHMKVLAKILIRQLPNDIRLDHSLLARNTHTEAQHNRNKQERKKIKPSTFQVVGKIPEHIALLDDVITTGATIEACVTTLKKAGAKRIDVWSFTRTAPPNFDL